MPQHRNPKRRKNLPTPAGVSEVDWKDVGLLRGFVSDWGKIRSRRVTRTPVKWRCRPTGTGARTGIAGRARRPDRCARRGCPAAPIPRAAVQVAEPFGNTELLTLPRP